MMPELYDDVDFSQDIKFLDKELRDIIQVSLKYAELTKQFIEELEKADKFFHRVSKVKNRLDRISPFMLQHPHDIVSIAHQLALP